MKNLFRRKNEGFTLIELLVVVLIIGILSAIALPQYQKAVNKTRIMERVPALNALGKSEQVYYLANGEYTTDLTALDVSAPPADNNWEEIYLDTDGNEPHLEVRIKFLPNYVFLVYQLSEDKLYCAQSSTAKTEQVCQRYFGNQGYRVDPSSSSYEMYPVVQ